MCHLLAGTIALLSFFPFSFKSDSMKVTTAYGGHRNGSITFYPHMISPFYYSDGIKRLARDCRIFWLISLIIDLQKNRYLYLEKIQVWELSRLNGNSFEIIVFDENNRRIASQNVPFADFKLDQVTLLLVDYCLLLPNEFKGV